MMAQQIPDPTISEDRVSDQRPDRYPPCHVELYSRRPTFGATIILVLRKRIILASRTISYVFTPLQHLKRSNSDSALWEPDRSTRVNSNWTRICLEDIIEQQLGSDENKIVCCPIYQNPHKHKVPVVVCEENDEEVESYSKEVPCFVMLLMISVWAWLLMGRQETITIGGSVVELLSFMVFVSGAALTILFGERFSHTHGAIFISWAVLMHVGIDHSISLLFLAILALFFGASHALSSFITHNNNQIQQHIKPEASLDLQAITCYS
ncbi:uncharacterized protein LOC130976494 [Arachis stenosperma]|uniref:uncharacterized protein LOC130976494 n=1 Tax=Arachis stenosperma TaxID=217475 RepID=UPI0025ACFE53|nr:uncharacterized protein LOC130976494 [Arachis stenosperma]